MRLTGTQRVGWLMVPVVRLQPLGSVTVKAKGPADTVVCARHQYMAVCHPRR